MMQHIMPESELNFDDIFDLWLPAWWESPWIWFTLIVGILAFIVLIGLTMYWYKKYKKKRCSPRDRALDRIVFLKKRTDEEDGQRPFDDYAKELYAELLLIIKQYLDDTHGLQVLGKTDAELCQYFAACDASGAPEILEWKSCMPLFSEQGTAIKFGCGSSHRSDFLNECENVHNILKRTSQKDKRM